MQELVDAVTKLVTEEYDRAAKKFGEYHTSEHQAFAVALEELEEAQEEVQTATDVLGGWWQLVRSKDADMKSKLITISQLQVNAILGACELIQLGAMAHKAAISLIHDTEEK